MTAAYMYDAVLHISRAVYALFLDRQWIGPNKLRCSIDVSVPWPGGPPLMETLRKVRTPGVLGKSGFDDTGYNINSQMQVLRLEKVVNKTRVEVAGMWDPVTRLNTTARTLPAGTPRVDIRNKTFRVVTLEEEPFVFKRMTPVGVRWEGFAMDMLTELSKLLGFKYKLYEVQDKKYGSPQEDGTWSGMIGDVMQGKADFALSAITITPQRERVVDFTKRYMDFAVGILLKKPVKKTDLFVFLDPFHVNVSNTRARTDFLAGRWKKTLPDSHSTQVYLSSVGQPTGEHFDLRFDLPISLRLHHSPSPLLHSNNHGHEQTKRQRHRKQHKGVAVHHRGVHPGERGVVPTAQNRHRKTGDDPNDGPDFNLRNTMWFVYGSFVQQGVWRPDDRAHAHSDPDRRVVALHPNYQSSYTANLAAFLTVTRMDSPIRSFDDLASQTEIPYGTVTDTSIAQFLASSDVETYQRLWSFMKSENNSAALVRTAQEGFQRVRKPQPDTSYDAPTNMESPPQSCRKYAFLWDVPVIEYEALTDKNCELTTVGKSIYSKGYGIAFPSADPYRDEFTLAKVMKGDTAYKAKIIKGMDPDIHLAYARVTPKESLAGKVEVGAHNTVRYRPNLAVSNKFSSCKTPARWTSSDTMVAQERQVQVGPRQRLQFQLCARPGQLRGVFCVLAIGVVLACAVALLEVLWHMYRRRRENATFPPRRTERACKGGCQSPSNVTVRKDENGEIHIIVSPTITQVQVQPNLFDSGPDASQTVRLEPSKRSKEEYVPMKKVEFALPPEGCSKQQEARCGVQFPRDRQVDRTHETGCGRIIPPAPNLRVQNLSQTVLRNDQDSDSDGYAVSAWQYPVLPYTLASVSDPTEHFFPLTDGTCMTSKSNMASAMYAADKTTW
ncbi:Glutamate receptor ionotropic, delta-1, partial [Branchiostoma belcheri]